jgi:rhodanese-related sulfurtransferase
MKTSKDYMAEANAVVPRLSCEDAIAAHANASGVFVDVRDSAAIAVTGTIQGAHHIPRGMLEFIADRESGAHNPALSSAEAIYVVCAAGGQAALAGKTLRDMGYENVFNIGGVGPWAQAGGPTQPAPSKS